VIDPIAMISQAQQSRSGTPVASTKFDWEAGLLRMIRDSGRRLILRGSTSMVVLDSTLKTRIYDVEYRFGGNSYVVWDKVADKPVHFNMLVNVKGV
jgi:hypothetical protein